MKRKPVCPECGSTNIAEMSWVLTLAYIEYIQDEYIQDDEVTERIEYTGETHNTETEKPVVGDKFHCGDCGHEFITPNWYEYITVLTSDCDTYEFNTKVEILVKYHGGHDEEEVATIIDEFVAEWVSEYINDTLVWGWKRQ